jgi:hypothetical protein
MATYIQIGSTVTVGAGGASTIDFTSIPGTYTDLVLILSARSNLASGSWATSYIQFNGSTTGYSDKGLAGNGATAFSFSNAGSTTKAFVGDIPMANNTASTFSNHTIYIPSYAGSTNKSISVDSVQENNGTTSQADLIAALWSNTAAITSIKLLLDAGQSFVQYTTASLYGISKS